MTEAYGREVPRSIGRFEFDQERSENVEYPTEDAYYYADGNGNAIAIEKHEWKGGYTVSKQGFGPMARDCIMWSLPIGDYEDRQQAFEAAQKEFGPGRLQQVISAARQLLGGE